MNQSGQINFHLSKLTATIQHYRYSTPKTFCLTAADREKIEADLQRGDFVKASLHLESVLLMQEKGGRLS